MPTITTFQNGQVLTSSALTDTQMDILFQLLMNQIFGVVANLQLICNLTINSNVIATPLISANIGIGFEVIGLGIPILTTIIDITGQGNNYLITLSNEATLSGIQTLSFYDPEYNTRVRVSWQQKGAPGFGITDDVLFIRCVLEPTSYNVRDESWKVSSNDPTTVLKNREYTRQWRIAFVAYGPNGFDSVRLIRSMLLEDFPHDTLAASNLYLVPDTVTPDRNPELFEGEWWERIDWAAVFNEQVNETITIPNVASIPVIGTTSTKQEFATTILGE